MCRGFESPQGYSLYSHDGSRLRTNGNQAIQAVRVDQRRLADRPENLEPDGRLLQMTPWLTFIDI